MSQAWSSRSARLSSGSQVRDVPAPKKEWIVTAAQCNIEHILKPQKKVRAHAPGPDMLAAGGTLRFNEAPAGVMAIKEEE
jgi:hypothetical protein